MNVTLESSGNLLIAYLFGEIDHHTAVAAVSYTHLTLPTT